MNLWGKEAQHAVAVLSGEEESRREQEVKTYEAWAEQAEEDRRLWRRVSVYLMVALLFLTFTSADQNHTIQYQRTLIKQLWSDASRCLGMKP